MIQIFQQIFNGKNSIRGASWILIVTLTLSNILGFFRDRFLAQKIPTDLLDTYYAAFRIPDLIFNLLILGAIASAFIPVFTGYITRDKEEEGWHVALAIFNFAIVALLFTLLILFFVMPYLIPILVPSFSPEKQHLTLRLARILLLSPFFFGISYILSGILNSFKRFAVYSIAPLVYNFSIIFATYFFADRYGVLAPTLGVVTGAFLHMAIQAPQAYKLGFRYRFLWDTAHQSVRKIGKLMIPRSIGLGAQQILLFVFTALASSLGGGAVAVYNLADNIQTVPSVIFGASFATAIFPTISEAISHNRQNEFSYYIIKTLRTVLFLLIPMSAGMILLRIQLVRLILGSGYFGWEQTISTANTLGFFALSLAAAGAIPILARGFYALQDTKTPTVVTILGAGLSIILGLLLSKTFGVPGLAAAYTLGNFLIFGILYLLLRRRILDFQEREFLIFIFKVLLLTLLMALTLQGTKILVGNLVDMQRAWGVLLQFLLSACAGIAVYLGAAYVINLPEVKNVRRKRE